MNLDELVEDYLQSKKRARSEKTAATYGNAMTRFKRILHDYGVTEVESLTEDAVLWFVESLHELAPATERLYLSAVFGFYKHLATKHLQVNLPIVATIIENYGRKPSVRLPQFPREAIETVINYAQQLHATQTDDDTLRLVNYRDRAFILTLADTGLRVHEACGLVRGTIDFNEGRAVVVGKGNREAVVRFSGRALQAIKDYLALRTQHETRETKPIGQRPVFARHNPQGRKRALPISTKTGQEIVKQRVTESLGPEAVGTITPHSFRHYFVTVVLRASGNMKIAQELARHKTIAVTQRYAHLSDDDLDRNYMEIFDK